MTGGLLFLRGRCTERAGLSKSYYPARRKEDDQRAPESMQLGFIPLEALQSGGRTDETDRFRFACGPAGVHLVRHRSAPVRLTQRREINKLNLAGLFRLPPSRYDIALFYFTGGHKDGAVL